jgi:Leucine-rich repeat (LRR) protein
MLSSRSSDEGAALADIHSAQFRAYAWLVADESYAQVYIVQRLLQRYALATLYFATNGPHWLNNDKWLSLSHECDWYGVSGCPDSILDGDGVVSIDLTGNGLKGPLPPEVLGLETLSSVLLANNELSGPIPKEIGVMSKAKIIDLGENQLTSIPSEMGTLSAAIHVFIQGNNFGSQLMPVEVCELRTGGSLTMLWADCMQCPLDCCTTCFSGWSMDEENDVGGTFNNTSITLPDLGGELLASLKDLSHGK